MTIIHHHEAFQPYLLKSLTWLHLLGWLEALDTVLHTDDCPFDDTEELAAQLEHWRAEFQANSGNHAVKAEEIKVITYGTDIILLCKELTGEFIKLTVTP